MKIPVAASATIKSTGWISMLTGRGCQMVIRCVVMPNTYLDSVVLMRVYTGVQALAGVQDAACVMGTERNKAALQAAGLLVPEADQAGPGDLVLVVRGVDVQAAAAALQQAEALLRAPAEPAGSEFAEEPPHTLAAGTRALAGANLALISVPGPYAAAEARKALALGLHVHLFSDHVSLDEEVELKQAGRESGLLVMGPDCGTSLIHGVPLGFGNLVSRGPVGIVGASGTGIQEVSGLIDRLGSGISHAIGTGGRDLSDAVGAITTLMGLDALEADPLTRVIVLIAKPPGPWTRKRVLERLGTCSKPVVVAFPGADLPGGLPPLHLPAHTLEEAATLAAGLASGRSHPGRPELFAHDQVEAARREAEAKHPGQRWLRGLFAGGTLAHEAFQILTPRLGAIESNLTDDPGDRHSLAAHLILDLGAERFTRGRPHPIIDPALRAERLVREAADPAVAVVLFDLILGVGAHPDPAGVMVNAVERARVVARHPVSFVASVTGTDRDPQNRSSQADRLRRAGVMVLPSNAAAAGLAGQIAAACSERRWV